MNIKFYIPSNTKLMAEKLKFLLNNKLSEPQST
jgi:hypothetical protein